MAFRSASRSSPAPGTMLKCSRSATHTSNCPDKGDDMKKFLGVAAILAVGFVGGAYAQKAAAEKKGITQQKPADMTWKAAAPNMPVEAADSWKGAGGAHCTFNKFPKGFVAPTHTHSNDVYSIVVAGKWGSNVEGSPQALQGPGGYQFIPGGL